MAVIDRIVEFLFNGFWAKLDVSHWRKTVLLVFIIFGTMFWYQYRKIEAVCDAVITKPEYEKKVMEYKGETEKAINDIKHQIEKLTEKIDENRNLFLEAVKDALKEARKK